MITLGPRVRFVMQYATADPASSDASGNEALNAPGRAARGGLRDRRPTRGIHRGTVVLSAAPRYSAIAEQASQLGGRDAAQCPQIVPHRVPDQGFVHAFIFVPVNVAGGGHGHPVDLRVPVLEFGGQAP